MDNAKAFRAVGAASERRHARVAALGETPGERLGVVHLGRVDDDWPRQLPDRLKEALLALREVDAWDHPIGGFGAEQDRRSNVKRSRAREKHVQRAQGILVERARHE